MSNEFRYVTIKDIAKQVNTTPGTVSFALHGSNGKAKRYISKELKEKILKAAKELNYIPSNVASNLKGKPRKLLAVLIPQLYNEFFIDIALSIENYVEKYGYAISICNTFDSALREENIVRRMLEQRVDGFFLAPSPNNSKTTLDLVNKGIPLVVLDRYFSALRSGYHSIRTQNYESSLKACGEIVKAGYDKFAFIDWNACFGGLELRRKAFFDTLEAGGLESALCPLLEGELNEKSGYLMTKQVIEHQRGIKAIVYANNILARGGIEYLSKINMQAGKDLSIAMVGAPKWALTGQNDFTCVDLNGSKMGEESAKIMVDILNGRNFSQGSVSLEIKCTLHRGTSIIKL